MKPQYPSDRSCGGEAPIGSYTYRYNHLYTYIHIGSYDFVMHDFTHNSVYIVLSFFILMFVLIKKKYNVIVTNKIQQNLNKI